jgi:CxxC-x17-CxxC domain-containing protein
MTHVAPDPDSEETFSDSPEEPAGADAAQAVPAGGGIVCSDCGVEFVFSAEEKAEFASRGFQPPKRCVDCRLKRRRKRAPGASRRKRGRDRDRHPRSEERIEAEPAAESYNTVEPAADSFVVQAENIRQKKMAEFDEPIASSLQEEGDPDNFGNSIHYKGPGVDVRFGTARDGQPNFAPWEGAHGYLLTHHEAEARRRQGGDAKARRANRPNQPGGKLGFQRRDGRGPNRNAGNGGRKARRTFDIVCATCGANAQVPFKPLPGKPVYCRDCHKKLKLEGGAVNPPAVSEEVVESATIDPGAEHEEY